MISKLALCLFFMVVGALSVADGFAVDSSYTCAKGVDCLGAQLKITEPILCDPGMFCPGDRATAQWCPKSFFCNESKSSYDCTFGNYCPYGSKSPFKCPPGANCPASAYAPTVWLPLAMVFPVTIVALILWCSSCCCGKRSSKVASQVAPSTYVPGKSAPEAKSEKLHIKFENLQVAVSTVDERKVILKSVTGEFRPGKLTAIMGSSGAGKSTLMNVVLGRVAATGGKVFVNGKQESLARYSKVMGYVPQDDVLLNTLKVRTALEHSAKYRLPASTSAAARKDIVDRALDVLNLRKVESTRISRISGSERKRVNIGVEFVADPFILFLDEPTTGLDSVSSQDIVEALQRIARSGMTVIAVLHQPRFEIIQLFDDLLLLGKGGFSFYVGPTSGCLSYLSSLGFQLPKNVNPGDFFLDVLSCRAVQANGELTTLEYLENAGKKFMQRGDDDDDSTVMQGVVDLEQPKRGQLFRVQSMVMTVRKQVEEPWYKKAVKLLVFLFMGSGDQSLRKTPGFWRQLGFYIKRSTIEMYNDMTFLGVNIISMLVVAICFGSGFSGGVPYWPVISGEMINTCPYIVRDRCEKEPSLGFVVYLLSFYLTMILGACWAVGAVPTFGNDRNVYYREMSSGASPAAFFIAKCVVDLITIVLTSCLFTALFTMIMGPSGAFEKWLGTIFGMGWAAFGLGYLISCTVSRDKAFVVSAVVAIGCGVTSGFSPTNRDVSERWGPLEILFDICYNRWAGEAMVILLTEDYRRSGYNTDDELVRRGYNPSNFGMDIGILILLGFSHRIVGFLFLRLRNRSKQE